MITGRSLLSGASACTWEKTGCEPAHATPEGPYLWKVLAGQGQMNGFLAVLSPQVVHVSEPGSLVAEASQSLLGSLLHLRLARTRKQWGRDGCSEARIGGGCDSVPD